MEKLHIQPSELDALPFYEYEYTFEIYNDIIKERNDTEKKEHSKYDDKYNIKSIQGQAMKNVKIPSMSNVKIPR